MTEPKPFTGGFAVLTAQPNGSWQDDWDGTIHADEGAAKVALGKAAAALGPDHALLVRVVPVEPAAALLALGGEWECAYYDGPDSERVAGQLWAFGPTVLPKPHLGEARKR